MASTVHGDGGCLLACQFYWAGIMMLWIVSAFAAVAGAATVNHAMAASKSRLMQSHRCRGTVMVMVMLGLMVPVAYRTTSTTNAVPWSTVAYKHHDRSAACATCCLNRSSHAGIRVVRFRHLLSTAPAVVRVAVVGNSVARSNNFGATRSLIEALEAHAPSTQFLMNYAMVRGGFEPDHLYHCGLRSPELKDAGAHRNNDCAAATKKSSGTQCHRVQRTRRVRHARSVTRSATRTRPADVIVVQYSNPRSAVYEKLLRALLQLPKLPLVMYVSHCLLGAPRPNPGTAVPCPLARAEAAGQSLRRLPARAELCVLVS